MQKEVPIFYLIGGCIADMCAHGNTGSRHLKNLSIEISFGSKFLPFITLSPLSSKGSFGFSQCIKYQLSLPLVHLQQNMVAFGSTHIHLRSSRSVWCVIRWKRYAILEVERIKSVNGSGIYIFNIATCSCHQKRQKVSAAMFTCVSLRVK